MYVFLFCLIIDVGFYVLVEPPLLLTTIIREVFGVTGMLVSSSGIWWLLTLLGVGAMIRLKTKIGGVIVVLLSALLWMLNMLSPLGAMTLALEYPNLMWGVLELFYVLILVSVELMIFKR
ncbi:hypothetical protein [Marinomonas pollencensis]|uniref:Uncharacterized protein n=1 Tax=Marinomonas pollencensis TaxID=491954 RepID=A0A3E0DSR5_9GAMM|nr:hypothetical protein [Marinomonas pollencensis]REG86573.1 hypothetical protein DFP81_101138 [Marinomonas pollencensis]